jgi:hypothetical protein
MVGAYYSDTILMVLVPQCDSVCQVPIGRVIEQDLRLPAVRFSAGVLHGLDGHSRSAAHVAVPQPAGSADGAEEKQDRQSADGSRGELQRLHKAGYFRELLATNPDINEGLSSLLRGCRETVVRLH